jgi:hypothetical protein
MNLGESARGDVFIFITPIRADRSHDNAIRAALQNPAIIGGAFYLNFIQRHPHSHWSASRLFTRYGGSFYTSRYSLGEKSSCPWRFRPPLMEDLEFPEDCAGPGRRQRLIRQLAPRVAVRYGACDYGRERTLDCSLPLRLFARPAPSLVLSGENFRLTNLTSCSRSRKFSGG